MLAKPKEKYFEAFFIALLAAFLFFIPYIIIDKGYFLFYGDFNVQQVPFYKLCHAMVREGNIFWNWNTDLGANFIGSYSFYMLGSPFFWITLPFPTDWIPFFMGPLLILKFACSSLTGYIFIKRFVKNRNFALIGALLYAFSGFSVYNIFFNHFHEAIVFFPLLLTGLEEFMQNNRRGLFAVIIFFTAIANFFFFAGMVMFVVIYWLFRLLSGAWDITLKKFFLLALEALLGLGLSMALLCPTIIVVSANPRTTSTIHGFGALFYGWEQRYGGIISCFFFPPDLPARPNMFPNGGAAWASLGAWLPLFSMTGVIGWMQTKNNFLKKLLIFLGLCTIIPLFNSIFFLFNDAYYGRWFYMLILMMALATAMAFERKDIDWNRSLRWTFGITMFFVLTVGFLTQGSPDGVISKIGFHNYGDAGNPKYHFSLWVDNNPVKIGLYEYPDRFWVHVVIALASLLAAAFLLKLLKKDKARFAKASVAGIFIISIIYSLYFIGTGKTLSYDTRNFIIPYGLEGREDITIDGIENTRIDVFDPMDNMGMFWQIPSIHSFHSVVPASVMEFYPQLGIERSVGTRPEMKYGALRSLLSVEYMFDYAGDSKDFGDPNEPEGSTEISGFSYFDCQNQFHIWKNDNYIPLGFTFEYYITKQEFDDQSKDWRNHMLLKGILLDDDQIARYGHLLTPFEDAGYSGYSSEDLASDCADRNREAAYYFHRDNHGFDSKIILSNPNLVFYSVPYEEGWSATVNGEPVKVEKVDNGLIAIECPAGDNTIRFNYKTPGLDVGILISLLSLLAMGAYLSLVYLYRKKHPPVTADTAPLSPFEAASESFFNSESETVTLFEDVVEDVPPPENDEEKL